MAFFMKRLLWDVSIFFMVAPTRIIPALGVEGKPGVDRRVRNLIK
jgi:hypothetical protein